MFMPKFTARRRKINEFCENSGKYTPDAYEFITDCVIQQVNELTTPRHLSGLEVLQGVSARLEKEFGFLASEVLNTWQINSASDIGEIIFDLIQMQILSASPDDHRSDFDLDHPLLPTEKRRRRKIQQEIPKID